MKEDSVKDLQPGRYRHYKGKDYAVFRVARHSETEAAYVVYRLLYGDGGWWVRPYDMFVEEVDMDGRLQPRFEYIAPLDKDDFLIREK
jgi:hypothetical protein